MRGRHCRARWRSRGRARGRVRPCRPASDRARSRFRARPRRGRVDRRPRARRPPAELHPSRLPPAPGGSRRRGSGSRLSPASVAACHACAALRPVLEDGPPRRLEQRFVIEEEEMSVEDRRAVLARPGGDRLTCGAGSPSARARARARARSHSAAGSLAGPVGISGSADAKVPGRSKRRSGRARRAPQRAFVGTCGWRGTGRRLRGGGLLPLVEIARRPARTSAGKRLICLRPARRDEHLVALPHSERRQPVETPPARGSTAGRHVGDDVTSASKLPAVWTKRAAGRACKPSRFRTSNRTVAESSSEPAGPVPPHHRCRDGRSSLERSRGPRRPPPPARRRAWP